MVKLWLRANNPKDGIVVTHKFAAATLALFLSTLCGAATASPAASPASEVDKYLAGLATWTADFTQTIEDDHGKVLRSAAGKLYLQRPGKFRWDYSQPRWRMAREDRLR